MKFLDLSQKIRTDIFSLLDVRKLFPEENPSLIKTQLNRFVKKNYLIQIKRGLYGFSPDKIDEFQLANILYEPSYISLETALNYYGLLPDIPQTVTSITVTTTKFIKNQFGSFSYTKIKPALFWGFKKITDKNLVLAKKEKALLDYFYIRKIKSGQDLRLNLGDLDIKLYKKYQKSYPSWVGKIML